MSGFPTISAIATPLSAVEVYIGFSETGWPPAWGGDYQLDASGDLITLEDTADYPWATVQRVMFLVMSNPALQNVLRNTWSPPDDVYYANYGAGTRAYVGRSPAQSNLDAIENAILGALTTDDFVSRAPKPIVTLTPQADGSSLTCTINFATRTGQNATTPDFPLAVAA